jgi:hypothetical protein
MKEYTLVFIVVAVFTIIVIYPLSALFLMYLWNGVVVPIFGLQPLTYQLAFGLFALLGLIASIFKQFK